MVLVRWAGAIPGSGYERREQGEWTRVFEDEVHHAEGVVLWNPAEWQIEWVEERSQK